MTHLSLQLFVSGQSARSLAAIRQAAEIRTHYPADACQIEIVDVLSQAELAERHHVIATPTLIRLAPLPVLRIVGDIQDLERVLALLDPPAALGRPM